MWRQFGKNKYYHAKQTLFSRLRKKIGFEQANSFLINGQRVILKLLNNLI